MTTNMARVLFAAGVVVLAALAVAIVMTVVSSPVAARRAELETQLETARIVDFAKPPRIELPYDRFHEQITGKPALWSPIAEPPKAPAKPPEWDKLLQGVRPTRQEIGTGNSRKVKVMLSPNDKQGRWVRMGEAINGAIITDITATDIEFTMEQNGIAYTHRLGRS